jgi:hypothetical protein
MTTRMMAAALLLGGVAARADGPAVTGATSGATASAAVSTPSYSAFGGGPIVIGPVCPGPGPIRYNPRIVYLPGPDGWTPYAPPLIVIGPGGGFPVPPPRPTPLLPPEPVIAPPVEVPMPPPVRPVKKANPERAALLVKLGDRHFRAKNLPRAVGRYEQALAADPASAAPRARLAQVAIARRQYREAVLRLREAQTAEPGWLAFPDDVQGLYPEPAEFAAMIGALETHLQAHPEDRDACLVLGAQLFLSGRIRQAADVFLRLTDRAPDKVLAAFLTASRAVEN